ncbi:MAG: nicotinamide-nucleotide amidohydrolase family protein, partial [Mogibacterium sp.]|nr:nicotinamide-nucleotide amidohydrolase family protein [Mogibacterium sp.]
GAVCFPGPPREMKWVVEHGAAEYLKQFLHKQIYDRVSRTIGIGESDLEMMLMPVIRGQTDPTIATYAQEGECTFRIASRRDTLAEAKAAVDEMLDEVKNLVGSYIYSCDDEELNEVVVRRLKEKGLTLSSAESCTAGLFAASVTDVAGASKVFSRGYITYDEEAKITMVGVDPRTIDRYSVVSAEVAKEMARGARLEAGSDIAVAITGFAGPEADEGREAGESYIGYAYEDTVGAVRVVTGRNDRLWNRNYFRLRMLKIVYEIIEREF